MKTLSWYCTIAFMVSTSVYFHAPRPVPMGWWLAIASLMALTVVSYAHDLLEGGDEDAQELADTRPVGGSDDSRRPVAGRHGCR